MGEEEGVLGDGDEAAGAQDGARDGAEVDVVDGDGAGVYV